MAIFVLLEPHSGKNVGGSQQQDQLSHEVGTYWNAG